MKQKGNKKGFTGCAQAYIRKLQEEGRFSTAHVYKNAVLSFTKFCTTPNIAFGQIPR
jgi:integrase/recombinase XerD